MATAVADEKDYKDLPQGAKVISAPSGGGSFSDLPKGASVVKPGTPNQDPLVTGKGMEEKAHQQARSDLAMPINKAIQLKHNQAVGGTNEVTGIPEAPGRAAEDVGLTGAALAIPAGAAAGGVPGALAAGRGLIGGTIGAGLGEQAGSRVGGLFGQTGREIGGWAGGLGGGLIGGGLGAGLERNPATSLQSQRGIPGQIKSLPFGIQRAIPEWMVPKGELGSPTNPGPFSDIPLRMPKADIPSAPIDPVAQAVKEGRASRIPTTMPKPEVPPAPVDPVKEAINQGI